VSATAADVALISDARARRTRRPNDRELLAKGVPALAFLICAGCFALFADSSRDVGAKALVLVALFVFLSRVEFEVGSGSAVPTQFAFVPMLFVLPVPLVPLAVAFAYVLGAAFDMLARGRAPGRVVGTIGCSWFALPSAFVVWAAGEPTPRWSNWAVLLGALASQVAADALHTGFHERVAHGLGPRELWRPLGFVYAFDVLVSPLALMAADTGGWSFLALLPVVAVFKLAERERRTRFDALFEAARLERLAITDDLTGLANRRRFDQAIADALTARPQGGISLCLFDLDHFKAFNDQSGHIAGDALLRCAAASWQELLPDDALFARLGGEEFALLVRSDDPEAVEELAERVRAATPGVTCSVGVAHRKSETRPAELINRADAALYAAKSSGRDCLRVEHRAVPRRFGDDHSLAADLLDAAREIA
jgi:diguanylate cyclase (GGDEF)-like protein